MPDFGIKKVTETLSNLHIPYDYVTRWANSDEDGRQSYRVCASDAWGYRDMQVVYHHFDMHDITAEIEPGYYDEPWDLCYILVGVKL